MVLAAIFQLHCAANLEHEVRVPRVQGSHRPRNMPSLVEELKSWCSTFLARIAAFLSVRPPSSLQAA